MATLLTGASGLVGANLARALCATGERPRVLLRERSDRRGLRGLPIDQRSGDLLDPQSLTRALEGVDRLFHAAGLVRFDPWSGDELWRVHVDGTRNLLDAARACGVKRVVVVSSIVTVGHGPLSAPATEATRFNFPDNPYVRAKREAEAYALSRSSERFQVVVCNPTFVVGPHDARPSSGRLLLELARGAIPAYPSGGSNFVRASDVADGLLQAMEKGVPGERYILGGENLTYRQFLTLCAEECGARPPLLPVPDAVLMRAGKLGDAVGQAAPERFRFLNSAFLESLALPAYASSGKAERALGYAPGPVRQGVRDAYRWFQEEGMLRRDVPLTPRAAS